MTRFALAGAALALASLVTGSALEAQQVRPWHAGIGAGVAVPMGEMRSAFDAGVHAELVATFKLPAMPVGIRAQAMYERFESKIDDGSGRNLAGAINADYALPLMMLPVKPYLTAGVGLYNWEDGVSGSSSTNVGINGGAGLQFQLAGFSTYLETRLQNVFTEGEATRIVPVSFGMMF